MDDQSGQSPPKGPINEGVPADTKGMCLAIHLYVADYAILSPCISLLKQRECSGVCVVVLGLCASGDRVDRIGTLVVVLGGREMLS